MFGMYPVVLLQWAPRRKHRFFLGPLILFVGSSVFITVFSGTIISIHHRFPWIHHMFFWDNCFVVSLWGYTSVSTSLHPVT